MSFRSNGGTRAQRFGFKLRAGGFVSEELAHFKASGPRHLRPSRVEIGLEVYRLVARRGILSH